MSKNNENKLVPTLRFPEFQNHEDWEEKKFGDLCKFIRGPFGGALKKEIFVSDGYAVYEQSHAIYGDFTTFRYFISEEKFNELKRFSVLPKDIIMSCSGTMGKFAIVPEKPKEGVINQALLKLTVKSGYEVGFIKTTLELPVNQNKLLSQSAGGAIKNVVEVAQIKEITLLIPSIKEQQKIAACLSSLDESITAESEKLEILNDHKKGLLQNLFPQEGETVPKFRFSQFEENGDWKETTLTQVADYENGKAHEQDIEDTGDFIVVNSKFISQDGEVKKFTNTAFLPAQKGDILMVLSDIPNGKAIAKCFLVEEDNRYTVNQRICRITPHKLNSKILYYLLNRNPYFLAFDDGVKQTNLRKEDVLNCPLLIPSDPKEQEKIAETLSTIDELIIAQSQKLNALMLHKKGLLQGLFPNVNEVTK